MSSEAVGVSESPTFEIGLVMAGAVSAGAYTAGVMDFLMEALDKWYAAKERDIAASGSNEARWTVPPHDIKIKVISGTSAGAMTAALTAIAFNEDIEPIRPEPTLEANQVKNRLYSTWVNDIDIGPMLSCGDKRTGVQSLLNSKVLDDIARKAI